MATSVGGDPRPKALAKTPPATQPLFVEGPLPLVEDERSELLSLRSAVENLQKDVAELQAEALRLQAMARQVRRELREPRWAIEIENIRRALRNIERRMPRDYAEDIEDEEQRRMASGWY
jgi:hypothetical protein